MTSRGTAVPASVLSANGPIEHVSISEPVEPPESIEPVDYVGPFEPFERRTRKPLSPASLRLRDRGLSVAPIDRLKTQRLRALALRESLKRLAAPTNVVPASPDTPKCAQDVRPAQFFVPYRIGTGAQRRSRFRF